jgi:cell wall-associated NlpC family hydrolase
MQGVRERIRPPAVPRWEDCSSFATWLYWLADAPDPNGRGYDGFGYTGTLCRQGRRVSILELQPGDLVFYGRGAPWGHVAIYVGGGKVVSHGSEGGPYLLPVRYRGDVGEARSYL